MAKLNIPSGTTFGKLTVIKEGDSIRTPSGQTNRTMLCVCSCGNKKQIRVMHLTRGRIKSCGCLSKTMDGESTTDIGKLFSGMKSRCSVYHQERHLYYDKGIKVCKAWTDDFSIFKKWCINNGYKKGLYIDRIDGNKGYSPTNCRFVTPQVNANNRVNTFYVEYKNKTIALKLLLKDLGNPNKYYTVYARIKRGWSVTDAIFTKPANNYSSRKLISSGTESS